MVEISVSRGLTAQIDDEDFERVSQYCWCATVGRKGRFYAISSRPVPEYGKRMLLHRFVMNDPKGMQVDHKNKEDTLNNQKSNLRVATHAQNQMNTGKKSNNTTGYKGVYLCKKRNRYRARVVANKVEYNLGLFSTPEQAYEAYCQKVVELHGEFAHI